MANLRAVLSRRDETATAILGHRTADRPARRRAFAPPLPQHRKTMRRQGEVLARVHPKGAFEPAGDRTLCSDWRAGSGRLISAAPSVLGNTTCSTACSEYAMKGKGCSVTPSCGRTNGLSAPRCPEMVAARSRLSPTGRMGRPATLRRQRCSWPQMMRSTSPDRVWRWMGV